VSKAFIVAQPDLFEDDRELLKIIRVGILIDRASTQNFHDETDFDGPLPAMRLPHLNVATGFDGLKPAQFLDGFVCEFDDPSTACSMGVSEVPVSSMSL
jgi:hypothetical protein